MKETKKELKRFFNDIKLPVAPIPDDEYLMHIINLIPEVYYKYTIFHDEKEKYVDFLGMWDKWKNKAIEEIKNRPKYLEFIKSDMSKWKLVDFPTGGFPNRSVFISENNGSHFLSIDLVSANFQALKKVGVHAEESWEDFIKKITYSEHIRGSKQFRSIVYGNLNIPRVQAIEKYLINEVRRFISDCIPDNYILWSMMPDELIYEIKGSELGILDFGKLLAQIETKVSKDIKIKVQQFQLLKKTIRPVSGGKGVDFYVKKDIGSFETVHCLGSPYYLLGMSLLKGLEPSHWDYIFLNQEGYTCKIEEKFIIES